jgi:hypothetical protein
MPNAIIRPLHDPRPDLFQGIAVIFIFVGEMSGNDAGFLALQTIGYWDAAVIFIFVSGYMAGFTYGRVHRRHGALVATLQICRRTWKLYVTYIVLLAIFAGEVSELVIRSHNPSYMHEMGLSGFLAAPHIAIVKALLLNFQPQPLAILPLCVVLLAWFPLVLQVMSRHRLLVLGPALVMYIGSEFWLGTGHSADLAWHYNPLAWQLLFIIGASCGYQALGGRALPSHRWVTVAAAGIVTLCAATDLSWLGHQLYEPFPAFLSAELRPLENTDLGPLRLVNFLALAILVVRALPCSSEIVRAAWLHPVVLCGRYASYVLCVGILLGALGHVILVEFRGGIVLQFAASAIGIAAMIATALLVHWYESAVHVASPRVPPRTPPLRAGRAVAGNETKDRGLPRAA